MKKLVLLFLMFIISLPVFAQDKVKFIDMNNGIYVFKIDTKKYGEFIKPYLSDKLTTPKTVLDDNNFELVVNGGFYDVKNGKSVSYVVINNELVSDVCDHSKLIENLKAENRLDNVLLRSEFRIMENKRHKLKFDIAYHTDSTPEGYTIKHSLQAGPMINPEMDLAKEGFVVYDDGMVKSQSVDILKRRERTLLGLKGKYLYIVIFTTENRMDAMGLYDYMNNVLKMEKSMALDGGLSTAISYKDIQIGSLGKKQRRVKSFLVIE